MEENAGKSRKMPLDFSFVMPYNKKAQGVYRLFIWAS